MGDLRSGREGGLILLLSYPCPVRLLSSSFTADFVLGALRRISVYNYPALKDIQDKGTMDNTSNLLFIIAENTIERSFVSFTLNNWLQQIRRSYTTVLQQQL